MASRSESEPISLQAEPPPLRVDEGGVIRVGLSRVSLDLVVEQYENGMTPDEMVRAYDTLELADVHGAIACYLRHRDDVRAYLKRRVAEAEALRSSIEVERPRAAREGLLARRRAREQEHASTRELDNRESERTLRRCTSPARWRSRSRCAVPGYRASERCPPAQILLP
jgi:uncharacterized protein (DUF433 family)